MNRNIQIIFLWSQNLVRCLVFRWALNHFFLWIWVFMWEWVFCCLFMSSSLSFLTALNYLISKSTSLLWSIFLIVCICLLLKSLICSLMFLSIKTPLTKKYCSTHKCGGIEIMNMHYELKRTTSKKTVKLVEQLEFEL